MHTRYYRIYRMALTAVLLAGMGGCDRTWRVYDAQKLASARKVLVLPAIGAPGVAGPKAGAVQTGLLVTRLAGLKRFDVEGAGRFRKAAREAGVSGAEMYSLSVQRRLAEQFDADLIVLCDVFDYRATTLQKNSSGYFHSSNWTESMCWAGVNLRMIDPSDGHLVYYGMGSAKSQVGYGTAMLEATDRALAGMASVRPAVVEPATVEPTSKPTAAGDQP